MRASGLSYALVLGTSVLCGVLGAAALHFLPLQQARALDHDQMLQKLAPFEPAEQANLDRTEKAYAVDRRAIEARLRDANARLAAALAKNPHWSVEVERITKDVEAAASDAERTALHHVFETRDGLTPAHRAGYDRALIEALKKGA